jgi:NAD(P)-dependent dehydrogenase (short-subunit alcohol dehydrogenase family)
MALSITNRESGSIANQMGLVDGKSGLVTGGAGGIGRATALCFAREGAALAVNDLEARREDGEETVRLIEAEGGRALFFAGDVTSAADHVRLVADTVAAFGRLDFAHNNAGVELQATVEDTEEDGWDRMLDVNLKGVWLGMKHQLPQMRAQGGGAIVNTASLAGLLAVPGLAAYIASKFGVVGLTKAAALEVADANIRVNCVCPAATRTYMIERLPPERQAELVAPQAVKRIGEPDEVAEAVVWLCSDRASLVTGTAFSIDLGSTAGVTTRT